MTNTASFLTRAVQHVDLRHRSSTNSFARSDHLHPTPAHQHHTAPTTTHARPTPQITLPRLAGHEYKPAPTPDPRTGGAKADDPRPSIIGEVASYYGLPPDRVVRNRHVRRRLSIGCPPLAMSESHVRKVIELRGRPLVHQTTNLGVGGSNPSGRANNLFR